MSGQREIQALGNRSTAHPDSQGPPTAHLTVGFNQQQPINQTKQF